MRILIADDDAMSLLERVRMVVAATPIATDFGTICSSLSIGIAVAGKGGTIASNALIQLADTALYQARQNGRNRIELAAGKAEE